MPRLLFLGDIHLGRRPSRLPEDLEGLRASELGPAAAWRAAVDLALEERVDAVVLAGDVVESEDDRFEAYGHLQAGVRRLEQGGVRVLGVAGNHDVRALPRLAAQVPGFRLLGARGAWEHVDVEGADGGRVRILGWSFPSRQHRGDPLSGLVVPSAYGLPVLGVMHCDLDGAKGGPYAPVKRADLAMHAVDAWFLGHVHRPDSLEEKRPVGYLGSLVGLDPGEPGAHGPWLVEVSGPGAVRARKVPLAPLRYERVAVALSALEVREPEEAGAALEDGILDALREVGVRCEADGSAARLVACRIVLEGRTPHHRAFARALQALAGLRHHQGTRTLFVETIADAGAAAVDLAALARGNTPPALLAARLLILEQGGPEARALIRTSTQRLGQAAGEAAFSELDEADLSEEAVRQLLLRAGHEALERLLEEGRAA